MMKAVIPALLMASLAACVHADTRPTKTDRAADKTLAKALEGRVPGKPVDCVSNWRGNDLHAIDDHRLLYKVSRNEVYVNNLLGTCNGLASGDTMVLHPHNSQYCRGDIARVVDLTNHMQTGSCALGAFTPYYKPGTEKSGTSKPGN